MPQTRASVIIWIIHRGLGVFAFNFLSNVFFPSAGRIIPYLRPKEVVPSVRLNMEVGPLVITCILSYLHIDKLTRPIQNYHINVVAFKCSFIK